MCASDLQSLLGLVRAHGIRAGPGHPLLPPPSRPGDEAPPVRSVEWSSSPQCLWQKTETGKERQNQEKKNSTKEDRGKERLSAAAFGWSGGPAFIRITGGRAGFDPVLRWERERLYCTFFNISQLDQNNALCTYHRMYILRTVFCLGHTLFSKPGTEATRLSLGLPCQQTSFFPLALT